MPDIIDYIASPPTDPLEGSVMFAPPPDETGRLDKPAFSPLDFTPAGDVAEMGYGVSEGDYTAALLGLLSLALPGTIKVRGEKHIPLDFKSKATTKAQQRIVEPPQDAVKITLGEVAEEEAVYKALQNLKAKKQREEMLEDLGTLSLIEDIKKGL